MQVAIPEKMFFKIGEVARLTGVKPYILRYWETEFPHLRPTKGRSQHRLYRRKDVEEIVRIKTLLYEEKFTIAGAKQVLKAEGQQGAVPTSSNPGTPEPSQLPGLRDELRALRELASRL